MFAAVVRLELRRSRTLLLWLLVLTVGYAGAVAAVYPVLRNNNKLLTDYMNAFPKEYLAAFGMEGSLVDPGVFWTTYIGSMLWPIVAAMAGIIVATRVTAADTERGWAELPLSGRLARTPYLLASILVQALVLALLAAAMVFAVVAFGAIVGAGFDAPRFMLAGVAAWLFGCAIAAVTSLLAAVTLSRGFAAGFVAGGLLVMYLLRAIAEIQKDVSWLANLSAFHYLSGRPIVDEGVLPVGDVLLFVGVSLLAWCGAILVFRSRDLIV